MYLSASVCMETLTVTFPPFSLQNSSHRWPQRSLHCPANAHSMAGPIAFPPHDCQALHLWPLQCSVQISFFSRNLFWLSHLALISWYYRLLGWPKMLETGGSTSSSYSWLWFQILLFPSTGTALFLKLPFLNHKFLKEFTVTETTSH